MRGSGRGQAAAEPPRQDWEQAAATSRAVDIALLYQASHACCHPHDLQPDLQPGSKSYYVTPLPKNPYSCAGSALWWTAYRPTFSPWADLHDAVAAAGSREGGPALL